MNLDKSIFPEFSLDRNIIKWENFIETLTPVQKRGDLYFKRDDFFAPLGLRSINGSKLRQLIGLVSNYVKNHSGASELGIIHGAVSGSPQHPMTAIVARHFDLVCIAHVGASKIAGNTNLEIAARNGAHIINARVGYARTLESNAFSMRESETAYQNFFVLETNITVSEKRGRADGVRSFHLPAIRQVENLPEHIETLIIPCGSANSATSILYGLIKFRPPALRRIVLLGIGNVGSTDLSYLYNRLELIENTASENFSRPNENPKINQIAIVHYDLNTSGFCRYADLMPFSYDGIDFHPRYEGKCLNWLARFKPELLTETSCFWIVGSEPKE